MDPISMYMGLKLKSVIGDHDLSPIYSISFSQGDGCAFEGDVDLEDAIQILKSIKDVKSASVLIRWKEFTDMKLSFSSRNRCVSQDSSSDGIYVHDLCDHVELGESFSDEIGSSVELALMKISEVVKRTAESCMRDIHNILMNCYGENAPVWSFKTRNFQVIAHERQIHLFDECSEFWTYEGLSSLAKNEARAYHLEVRIYDANQDLIASEWLHNVVDGLKSGINKALIRELVSELIHSVRSSDHKSHGSLKAA